MNLIILPFEMVRFLIFFFDDVFNTGKRCCWLTNECSFWSDKPTENWKFAKFNLLYNATLRFPSWIVTWIFAPVPLYVNIGITKFHASIVQQIEQMSRVYAFRRAVGFVGIVDGKLIPQY